MRLRRAEVRLSKATEGLARCCGSGVGILNEGRKENLE